MSSSSESREDLIMEVERLRAALEEISGVGAGDDAAYMRRTARDALHADNQRITGGLNET